MTLREHAERCRWQARWWREFRVEVDPSTSLYRFAEEKARAFAEDATHFDAEADAFDKCVAEAMTCTPDETKKDADALAKYYGS